MICAHSLAAALVKCRSESAVIATAVRHFATSGAKAAAVYDFNTGALLFSNFSRELISAYSEKIGVKRDPAVRISARSGKLVRIADIFNSALEDDGIQSVLQSAEANGLADAVGLFVTTNLATSNYVALGFDRSLSDLSDVEFCALQCDIELFARKFTAVRKATGLVRLSARERQFIRLAAAGASDKEIARSLQIAPSSVRTLVERTFEKLKVSTRTEAVIKAAKRGQICQCRSCPSIA